MADMTRVNILNRVCVTGGAGTCGNRIVESLLKKGETEQVISLDNNESSLFFQRERLKRYKAYSCSMTDILNSIELERIFSNVDLVIHCAAYKNVPMCELSPNSCVDINIRGTENIISASIQAGVSKVLFTSTDKAVNPTNIMGASKLVGERLVIAANLLKSNTVFAATRFGNVLGSSGSVLQLFARQVRQKLPMTITDPNMTRFMMSQLQAAELVLESADKAVGGEIYITKMPVLNIGKFAEAFYQLCSEHSLVSSEYGSDSYEIVGARPGEKSYEELMSPDELSRSKDLGKFFVVLPKVYGDNMYADTNLKNTYNSLQNAQKIYNSHEEAYLDVTQTKEYLESILSDDSIDINTI